MVGDFEEKIGGGSMLTKVPSEPDRLPEKPAFAEQESKLSRCLEDLRALGLRGFFRRAIFHQLDAKHEALAAHVSDNIVPRFQLLEAGQNAAADLQRILLQAFALD